MTEATSKYTNKIKIMKYNNKIINNRIILCTALHFEVHPLNCRILVVNLKVGSHAYGITAYS